MCGIIMENNFKKIKTIFTSEKNISFLSKDDLVYRELFLSKFQQKYDFSLSDIDENIIFENIIDNKVIKVKNLFKSSILFIFIDAIVLDKNNIEFYFDEYIEKIIRRNKGISFLIVSKNDEEVILNSKDYFDLYLKKINNKKILISNFKEKSFFKRISYILFK